MNFLLYGLFGGLGGLARSMLGLWKAISKKKKVRWDYWLITILTSIVIGIFVGLLFAPDYKLALLTGYAGTDIIEGIVKATKIKAK
jgi:fluoride ion exporter CrcB/FEX